MSSREYGNPGVHHGRTGIFREVVRAAVLIIFVTACRTTFLEAGTRDGITIRAIPSWVSTVRIPGADPDFSPAAGEGSSYLLVDEQYDVASLTWFYHVAVKVLGPTGLQELSTLKITYAPSYNRASVHYVRVRRNGLIHDLLSRQTFNILQRENSLEYNLYDGRLTGVLLLEDVRPGDTLEYAYSVRGQNPIFGGKFLGSFEMRYSIPIQLRYCRLRVPAGRTIEITADTPYTLPKPADEGGHSTYVWREKNVPALTMEEDVPSWYDPYPRIRLSEFHSWQDVAGWARDVYAASRSETGGLEEVVDRLRADHPTPEEYACAALTFVQDEIRYFGIEVGQSSHRPTSPAKVLKQRFGDCKDKSLLLCALLEGAGIAADPVLVNSWKRAEIVVDHPWPLAFDHVVVRIGLDGEEYFVDPTETLERGPLTGRCMALETKGLVVGEGSDGLVDIHPREGVSSREQYEEYFRITDFSRPVELEVVSKFYGARANYARNFFGRRTAKELEKIGYEYYSGEYDGVHTLEPMRVEEDDTVGNTFTLSERYSIDSFWTRSATINRKQAAVYATLVRRLLGGLPDEGRTVPLGINHPRSIEYVTFVDFPEPWDVEDDASFVNNEAFQFTYSLTGAGNRVKIEYGYTTLTDRVPPESFRKYEADVTSALSNIGTIFTKYPDGIMSFTPVFFILTGALLLGGFFPIRRAVRLRKAGADPPEPDAGSPAESTTPAGGDTPVIEQSPTVDDPAEEEDPDSPPADPVVPAPVPEGISGFLLLPAMGLIFRPLVNMVEMGDFIALFNSGRWDALTTESGEGYMPYFGALIGAEYFLNGALILFGVVAAIYFFRKLKEAPRLMIILIIAGPALFLLDALVVDHLQYAVTAVQGDDSTDLVRDLLSVIIWVPYFLTSKRVKNTFVR